MNNLEIREAIKRARLFGYEVAAALGMSETSFSRKLRQELSFDEKMRVLATIDKLSKEEFYANNGHDQ